jgi:predicted MFS family arabinose efflux permease
MSSAIGAGLGIGLGGRLAEVLGWRQVFLIYGAAGLLVLPLVLSVPEARRTASTVRGEPPFTVLRELLADPRLLLMWIAGLVAIASALGFAAWLPSYLVRDRGVAVGTAGAIFGGGALIGGIVGSLLGGFFADRRGRVRFVGEFDVAIVGALVATPLTLLTINSPSPWIYVPAGLVGLVAIYAFFPPLQAVLVALVPRHRHGLASSLNVFFLGGLGSALGPFVVGFTSDRTGSLHTAVSVPVIGLVVAAGLIATAGRIARRAPGARRDPLAPGPRV